MRIAALYKTFDGGEFVDASLASIYDHVDLIVMVHSDVSWLGERGNTVRPLAVSWCNDHDIAKKVVHIDCESIRQEEQYEIGLKYINSRTRRVDIVMAVDADEVWEGAYIENAKKQIAQNPFPAYRCNMHTYLKNPFFRVEPPYGSPTVFFTDPEPLTKSPRGCKAPAKQLSDVWMHHYTYVRETRADVERKIKQSCLADGDEKIIPGWMKSVYDNLPGGRSLHAFERWKAVWHSVKKVWLCDVPPAMRSASLFSKWWPDTKIMNNGVDTGFVSMLDGEKDAIYRLALGRNQAVDLGTYNGASAVALSLACSRVHTIDFYGSKSLDEDSEYCAISGHSLEKNTELFSGYGNITAESAFTAEAASRWNSSVDVLFVDADHSESGTLDNVHAWVKHMRQGGRIILHDNNSIHPGVQSAIKKMMKSEKFKFFDPGKNHGSIAVCDII